MKKLIVLFLILSSGLSHANLITIYDKGPLKKIKKNRRAKYPLGVNAYGYGPVGVGIGLSIDYFVIPKISLEAGASALDFEGDLGYFVGGRYHFFGNTPLNITPYLGVFSAFKISDQKARNYNLYIPFGVQRITKNKISWAIEGAYQRNEENLANKFYGGVKLGIRF